MSQTTVQVGGFATVGELREAFGDDALIGKHIRLAQQSVLWYKITAAVPQGLCVVENWGNTGHTFSNGARVQYLGEGKTQSPSLQKA